VILIYEVALCAPESGLVQVRDFFLRMVGIFTKEIKNKITSLSWSPPLIGEQNILPQLVQFCTVLYATTASAT